MAAVFAKVDGDLIRAALACYKKCLEDIGVVDAARFAKHRYVVYVYP